VCDRAMGEGIEDFTVYRGYEGPLGKSKSFFTRCDRREKLGSPAKNSMMATSSLPRFTRVHNIRDLDAYLDRRTEV
jgi:hypothetical protein